MEKECMKKEIPMYTLSGKVVHGRGIGKLVGMPTANLEMLPNLSIPKFGVYATRVYIQKMEFLGVTNVGRRPTIDNDLDVSIETHILNFNQDIYGDTLTIELYTRLRQPRKFENMSLLLEQLRFDCIDTKEYFGISKPDIQLCVDLLKHRVNVNGKDIDFSVKEFDVLYMLYSNPGVAFSKEQIYEAVWHEEANGYFHAVENTIFQIRRKLKKYSGDKNYIKTMVGYGYKFEA